MDLLVLLALVGVTLVLVVVVIIVLLWVAAKSYEMGWNDRDRGVWIGDKEEKNP
jgi:hypothetical protein